MKSKEDSNKENSYNEDNKGDEGIFSMFKGWPMPKRFIFMKEPKKLIH